MMVENLLLMAITFLITAGVGLLLIRRHIKNLYYKLYMKLKFPEFFEELIENDSTVEKEIEVTKRTEIKKVIEK